MSKLQPQTISLYSHLQNQTLSKKHTILQDNPCALTVDYKLSYDPLCHNLRRPSVTGRLCQSACLVLVELLSP